MGALIAAFYGFRERADRRRQTELAKRVEHIEAQMIAYLAALDSRARDVDDRAELARKEVAAIRAALTQSTARATARTATAPDGEPGPVAG
jgi:hypothetical protein